MRSQTKFIQDIKKFMKENHLTLPVYY